MKTLMWISLTALCLCTLCCSNSSTAPASQPSAASNTANATSVPPAEQQNDAAALIIITGRLLKKDGTPAPNVKLWLGSAQRKGNKFIGVKPEFYKGMLVFPGATTGADGRFEFRWNRDFFVTGHEYAMAVEDAPGGQSGVLNATFKFESGAGRIDLGDISSNLGQ